jgi:hypothetical protein
MENGEGRKPLEGLSPGTATLLAQIQRAHDKTTISKIIKEHTQALPDVDDEADPYGFAPIDDNTTWNCTCGEDLGTTASPWEDRVYAHAADRVVHWIQTGETDV